MIRRRLAFLGKMYDIGLNKTIGRVSGTLALIISLATLITVKGYQIGPIEMLLIGLGILSFILIAGFGYIKLGLLQADYTSHFYEQKELVAMRDSINEIKESLKVR